MSTEKLIFTVRQRLAFGQKVADLADLVAAYGANNVWLAYVAANMLDRR